MEKENSMAKKNSMEERLLDLIGNIPEEMLDEALNAKKVRGFRGKRVFYGIAAACVIVLFMRFVSVGQVMEAQIRENIERLLEELFPPKDISLTLEGMEENAPYEVYGELPKEAEDFSIETEEVSRENTDKAGFAIYVDMDSFKTKEEKGCYIIRGKRIAYTRQDAIKDNETLLAGLPEEELEQKIKEIMERTQDFYNHFATGEIRIMQKQEASVEDVAGEMWEEMSEHYVDVSDIMVSESPKGLYLRAAEGTGARFHSMIETFRVLELSD